MYDVSSPLSSGRSPVHFFGHLKLEERTGLVNLLHADYSRQGCVGYFVQITGRRAIYFGRNGDSHVEHFPPSPVEN